MQPRPKWLQVLSRWLMAGVLGAALTACGQAMSSSRGPPADADWPVFGGNSDETHYSELSQIDRTSVPGLSLAWHAELETPWSVTAPIAVDGKLYVAAGLSIVHAFDAATGKLLWKFDPKVHEAPQASRLRGPTWGIRGLAHDNGRLFVGTKDGRLFAIDAKTGVPAWEVMTLEAGMDSSNISGPPRVFAGKVIIGFGGADVGVTRGYVTAYDQKTGKKLWRFWTVPGNPADGFENEAMAMAARTWTGEWWKFGGGATAWNAITFDKELNRIYIGTGNGGPWNQKIRSPGGGDNLFVCAIVALDADTGKYLWHYQTVPGETWDFNSAMDIQLAHMKAGGKDVPVLYHAPKNGFFYVIDRRDGKLISADPWTKVTWASGIDMKTGRPIEAKNARYTAGPTTIYPASVGAHSWQPMSTSGRTGLVYIPETVIPGSYADIADLSSYKPRRGVHSATGIDFTKGAGSPENAVIGSALVAWDPVQREAVWRVKLPGYINGGVLSTAGGLVFQGRIDGRLVAYADDTGKELWSFDTRGPIIAPVITFARDGQQYVTVVTGMSGSAVAAGPLSAASGWDYRTYPRRVLTFRLGGKAALPPRAAPAAIAAAADPGYRIDAALGERGKDIYLDRSCIACHGPEAISGGGAPDLRTSALLADPAAFRSIVADGALAAAGMPRYDDMNAADIEALRQYIRSRAAALRTAGKAAP
jgi:quinohemoprotein ethanol dehydrogenase